MHRPAGPHRLFSHLIGCHQGAYGPRDLRSIPRPHLSQPNLSRRPLDQADLEVISSALMARETVEGGTL